MAANALYGVLQLARRAGRRQPRQRRCSSPLTGGASSINVYGAVNGDERLPAERAHRRPEPPRDHARACRSSSSRRSTCGSSADTGCRSRLGVAARASCSSSSSRRSRAAGIARAGRRLPRARSSRTGASSSRAGARARSPASRSSSLVDRLRGEPHYFETVFRSRMQTGGGSTSAHFGVYDFIPQILHPHPLFGLGLNNFSVYYEFVTGKTNWGPHSFYVALFVETGLVGTALFAAFLWYLFRRLRAGARSGARSPRAGDPLAARVRPLAWGLTAALAGTMAANVFYLTMHVLLLLRVHRCSRWRRRSSSAARSRRREGRRPDDVVSAVRRATRRAASSPTRSSTCGRRGVEVEVVSPATFRHFGIAYGAGIVGNLRAQPARRAALPAFLPAFSRRRGEPPATPISSTRTGFRPGSSRSRPEGPSSLQLWGTDVELARRARPLARPIVRRARIVICAVHGARGGGARARRAGGARDSERRRDLRPSREGGVDPPRCSTRAASPRRRACSSSWAARGMRLVVAGDGPLRDRVPGAARFRPARRARRAVCARRGGRVPVAPRRVRGRLRGGDGARAARRRVRGRRPARPRRRRRNGPPRPAGRRRRRCGPRSSACSTTRSSAAAWEPPARKRAEEKLSWDRVTLATLAAYGDL